MEAYEGYWRKMPSVKRLVFKSVPEATTRLAMLKRGEVDVAYLLDAPQAQEVKRDPKLKLAFSGGIGDLLPRLLRPVGPEVAVGRPARAPGRQPRDRSQGAERGGDARRLQADRQHRAAHASSSRCRSSPYPYDPAQAKKLLAEAGYPNGFDAGELLPLPPYFSMGEAIVNYLGAVGIRMRMRTMERAAFYSALARRRSSRACACASSALYGNAASRHVGGRAERRRLRLRRLSRHRRALQAAGARDRPEEARGACCTRSSSSSTSACGSRPIYEYIWPSGDRAAGGGARADADRPLSVVGAARGGAAQEELIYV